MKEKNMRKTSQELTSLANDALYQQLQSDPKGLTTAQVTQKKLIYGKNILSQERKPSVILRFLKNFTSLMAVLLWIGGAIAFFFTGTPQLGIAIWLVNIINGLFSFFQENKASKATEALKKMLPAHARVLRDGQEVQIMAEDLVPGDVMYIEEGDKISADARIVEATNLQVNQAALTGESNPVRKNNLPVTDTRIRLFELKNTVFAGTTVASGSATVVVSQIGATTEFGKIAHLTQSVPDEKSPLQLELDKLTKQISLISVSIGALFLAAAVFFVHQSLAQAFIFSLGMIVAFIPEGLLPTVTLSLAMAVQRMAKEHALVKNLASVETLGAATVICSDKTGTLTQNEMTVNHLWTIEKEYNATGLGYEPTGTITTQGKIVTASKDEGLNWLVRAASLCSNARILAPDAENSAYRVLGDPTEACLNVVAQKSGIDLTENSQQHQRLHELSFDSLRKRMTTIHALSDKMRAFTKGAPQETVDLCTFLRENGQIRPLTAADKAKIMQANDRYARQGLRVLAVAYRDLDETLDLPADLTATTPELIEQQLVFLGLIVMADPPREGVSEAVSICHEAHIKIIMITGDYGLTAISIAKKIGIVTGEDPRVISGAELEQLSDEDLKQALTQEVIFARVAPDQKYRIVSNLQQMDQIVAVTGDGVNDAPALKKADIGIAMGISGTDVAKESADMILTDDHFASIVRAIEEGRAVYANIQKFLTYIFSSNMAEAVPSAVFLFSQAAIPLPLTVMQILTVDLGTDMLPALGLGVEKPEQGLMKRPPRKRQQPLLTRSILIKSFFWYGLLTSAIAMGAYFFALLESGATFGNFPASGAIYQQATTMTLGAIIFCQIGVVWNCRTEKESIFQLGFFSNKIILLGILFEISLLALLVYLPMFHNIFNTDPLGFTEWLFLAACPIPIVLLEELRKYFLRKKTA